jgi:hypothetical protein
MLEVGNGGMSAAAYRSHFALWALMKAPLLVGCDVRNLGADARSVLLATEVIAVNQDSLGVAGDWVAGANSSDTSKVMAAPLRDGSRAAVLFNMQQQHSGAAANITVEFAAHLGFPVGTRATVRDLYAQRDIGTFDDAYTATVAPEDCAALRITPASPDATAAAHEWRPWHWRQAHRR